MKKYLLLLVVLLGSVCAYSQNKMVEAIHLKNGSVIKGVIIEQIPDKQITYSFDKNTMRLVIVFDSDPEPPIVYDVKVSEGWLKLDCISGDFEDFSMYKIK